MTCDKLESSYLSVAGISCQIVESYKYIQLKPRVTATSRKKYRIINLPKREFFDNMIEKMGPFIVSIFNLIVDKEMMEAIAMNCPNLLQLKIQLQLEIFKPPTKNLHLGLFARCKNLKQLSLNLGYVSVY